MSGTYGDPRQSSAAKPWSAWDLARLVFHFLLGWGLALLIVGLFILPGILRGEAVPILISAFAVLGMALVGGGLWAQAVGWPMVLMAVFHAMTMRPQLRAPSFERPWFDRDGNMLWQRDGRGGWVQKTDPISH